MARRVRWQRWSLTRPAAELPSFKPPHGARRRSPRHGRPTAAGARRRAGTSQWRLARAPTGGARPDPTPATARTPRGAQSQRPGRRGPRRREDTVAAAPHRASGPQTRRQTRIWGFGGRPPRWSRDRQQRGSVDRPDAVADGARTVRAAAAAAVQRLPPRFGRDLGPI